MKPSTTRRIATPSTGEMIGMAIESLWSNRLRTGLTMLGVIIGIGAVVAVTSVGQGVQKKTEEQIESLGTNVMHVMAGSASVSGIRQGAGSASTLTWEDAKTIAKQVTTARAVTAYLQRPQAQIVYGKQNVSTSLIGTDTNYPVVKNIYPQQGQFFTQADLDSAQAVAVLGSDVRDNLFGSGANAIGEEIRIRGKLYRVIGVMESKGAVGNQNQDDVVYIPLTNMSAEIVGNNALSGTAITGLWLSTPNSDQLDIAEFQVTNLLRLLHNIDPASESDDFNIISQVDIINTFSTVVGLFTIMITAIAGISLVVGSIGIANIMLVSVVERTREIGVRKAVGATNAAILYQFLIESVVVSTIGGGIGIVFGIVVSAGVATLLTIPLVISPGSIVTGFVLSAIVGLVAGVVPARNAARLDPILALHSE